MEEMLEISKARNNQKSKTKTMRQEQEKKSKVENIWLECSLARQMAGLKHVHT